MNQELLISCFKDFPCHMVQRGEAKLDCDQECEAHKMKQKKLTTEEEEIKKQEELRAQQVISLHVWWAHKARR